uniref:Uncharacterized protein n=1 Tax=Rhizophora mucronata TaxID=61149 RepID=A0A2P2P2X9_RHIMU
MIKKDGGIQHKGRELQTMQRITALESKVKQ